MHAVRPTAPERRGIRRPRRGFTLIEAALTTIIVGTGVLAIVAAQQAYHRKNNWSQRVGTAMHLANEMREYTVSMPFHDPITGTRTLGAETNEYVDGAPSVALFDDLDDFAGTVDGVTKRGTGMVISPPVNGLGQPIDDMGEWSQFIRVDNVLPQNIAVADDLAQPLGSTDLMRVSVTVRWQAPDADEPMNLTTMRWVVGQ